MKEQEPKNSQEMNESLDFVNPQNNELKGLGGMIQIEQKPARSENAKQMFIKSLERVEELNNKGYKLTDCDKNSWWEDFKAYCGYTEMQRSAWNEEDEKLSHAIYESIDFLCLGFSEDKLCDWLKSLKERMKGGEE